MNNCQLYRRKYINIEVRAIQYTGRNYPAVSRYLRCEHHERTGYINCCYGTSQVSAGQWLLDPYAHYVLSDAEFTSQYAPVAPHSNYRTAARVYIICIAAILLALIILCAVKGEKEQPKAGNSNTPISALDRGGECQQPTPANSPHQQTKPNPKPLSYGFHMGMSRETPPFISRNNPFHMGFIWVSYGNVEVSRRFVNRAISTTYTIRNQYETPQIHKSLIINNLQI